MLRGAGLTARVACTDREVRDRLNRPLELIGLLPAEHDLGEIVVPDAELDWMLDLRAPIITIAVQAWSGGASTHAAHMSSVQSQNSAVQAVNKAEQVGGYVEAAHMCGVEASGQESDKTPAQNQPQSIASLSRVSGRTFPSGCGPH